MAKVTLQENIKSVDFQTGEVTHEVTRETFKVENEPPFVKLYLDDIALLYNLPKGCSGILYALVKRMNYEGEITISAGVRRRIAKELNVSAGSIANALTKYIKSGVMTKADVGIYIVNPSLFAKGFWGDILKRRSNFIEMTRTYTNSGITNSIVVGASDTLEN